VAEGHAQNTRSKHFGEIRQIELARLSEVERKALTMVS
jgi:hypothetical protein